MNIAKTPALLFCMFLISCGTDSVQDDTPDTNTEAVRPDIITETTLHDTDDPAIWINPEDPSKSIVFGTDKDTDGAIYAFDLEGKVIESMSIRDLRRPNNVDIEYGFQLNASVTTDILVFTERERNQIRVFSVPDMNPLDQGGFPVFSDETDLSLKLPMGISVYKSPADGSISVIVGRKSGPLEGYLYQYSLETGSSGQLEAKLLRKFGKFSGVKEIEAIAVDDSQGFVYYADEGVCIRKYHADPTMGDTEISCFGGEAFAEDIEGIAIASYAGEEGYIIVSDQQNNGSFNIFSRSDNNFIKSVNLGTTETDGCEVVTAALNSVFKNGLFVAMNEERNFYFYDLEKLGIAP